MTGKDKLLRWARVFVDGYDLSGDVLVVGRLLNSFGEVPMGGLSNAVKYFLADQVRQVGIRGLQSFLNDATDGAFTVLKNGGGDLASVLFGGGAEPAIGDPAYLLGGVQLGEEANFDSGRAVFQADLLPDAEQDLGNPMGVVLHPKTSLSVTTNGASVDNGASSADGGVANLHIVATASGNFAYKLQDSANNSDWADLLSFTLDGGALGGERQDVAGSVDQYTRFVATRTAGSATPVCTFARN